MKKILKKDLSLNKEVVAYLSENEMHKVIGGDATIKDTADESVCLCKTVEGDIGCSGISHTHCGDTRLNCPPIHPLSVVVCGVSTDCGSVQLSDNTDCSIQIPTIEIVQLSQIC